MRPWSRVCGRRRSSRGRPQRPRATGWGQRCSRTTTASWRQRRNSSSSSSGMCRCRETNYQTRMLFCIGTMHCLGLSSVGPQLLGAPDQMQHCEVRGWQLLPGLHAGGRTRTLTCWGTTSCASGRWAARSMRSSTNRCVPTSL